MTFRVDAVLTKWPLQVSRADLTRMELTFLVSKVGLATT